jgi:hypothetical protein
VRLRKKHPKSAASGKRGWAATAPAVQPLMPGRRRASTRRRSSTARLRWTVSPSYEQANHHPTATISPGVDVLGKPGESLVLTAAVTDPDGDTVFWRWWQYREAGTVPRPVPIIGAETPVATVRIPDDEVAGHTLHLILEVRDDAELPLKAYQRITVTTDHLRPA